MPRPRVSLSAQQIDPLSWFVGPNLPLVLAVIAAVYGALSSAVTWSHLTGALWQSAGVVVITASFLLVHTLTRMTHRTFDRAMGAAAMTLSSLGMVASALGYSGTALRLELWWAPFGVALTLGALGPFLSTRETVVLGAATTAATVPICSLLLIPSTGPWGPVSAVIIIAFPLLIGTVVTGVFSHHVVKRMSQLLESRSQIVVSTDVVRDEQAERVERVRLAQLSARAVPFLEQVLEAGAITENDRALAGQLARRLRDDLVTQTNRSWLESIAAETHITVIDPDGRADRLPGQQRTALRGLVRAILDTPGIDPSSLLVEMRRRPGGGTAVGVSLDVELPEGRRIMHLAPYLLTLRTASDGLVWDDEQYLRVSFEFPPE